MKRIDWKVFVLLGIILSVAVGFLYGTGILGGDSASPGSNSDPLISQSYADSTISRKVQEMDDRIASLETTVSKLESEIAVLTGVSPDAATPGPGTSGTATPPTTTTPPASGGSVSSANVGKSATVTTDVVNLRESASTSSNIKKKLTPKDTFTITKADTDKGWYQVQLSDGTVGWVFGTYVKIK